MAEHDRSAMYRVLRFIRLVLFRAVFFIITLPYYGRFKRNTIVAVNAIIAEHDEGKLRALINKFVKSKIRECKYVQIAATVLFGAAISCLSWPSLATAHWSATALFYACIVFSLGAVVLGAQQIMILPGRASGGDASRLQSKLLRRGGTSEASYLMIFALQTPIMVFSFALISFAGGVWVVVLSPLVRKRIWDSDAKISTVFVGVNLVSLSIYFTCSAIVHRL